MRGGDGRRLVAVRARARVARWLLLTTAWAKQQCTARRTGCSPERNPAWRTGTVAASSCSSHNCRAGTAHDSATCSAMVMPWTVQLELQAMMAAQAQTASRLGAHVLVNSTRPHVFDCGGVLGSENVLASFRFRFFVFRFVKLYFIFRSSSHT